MKMKRWVASAWTFGILIGAAGHAQFGDTPGGNFPNCTVSTSLDVRYLGRNGARDRDHVEASWRTSGGVSGGLTGGFGANPAALCAQFYGIPFRYQLQGTIVRRLGHRDSASLSVDGPFGQQILRILEVPRGTLETDPESYELALTGQPISGVTATARASGAGAPSLQGATLFATTNKGESAQCPAPMAVTGLALVSVSGGDAVDVTWSRPPGNLCLLGQQVSLTVKVTGATGSPIVKTVSLPFSAATGRVALGQSVGQATSFEVSLTALLNTAIRTSQNRAGTF